MVFLSAYGGLTRYNELFRAGVTQNGLRSFEEANRESLATFTTSLSDPEIASSDGVLIGLDMCHKWCHILLHKQVSGAFAARFNCLKSTLCTNDPIPTAGAIKSLQAK
jgi:hypothetical protein